MGSISGSVLGALALQYLTVCHLVLGYMYKSQERNLTPKASPHKLEQTNSTRTSVALRFGCASTTFPKRRPKLQQAPMNQEESNNPQQFWGASTTRRKRLLYTFIHPMIPEPNQFHTCTRAHRTSESERAC